MTCSSLGGVEPFIPASESWNGQCLDSQRNEFWLAGMDLDLRFALGLLSGIFSPFLLVPPSCVSTLGNTSKCYPHSSAADCQA